MCGAPRTPPPAGRRRDAPSVANQQPARSTGGPTAARESAAVRPATCGRHTEWAFGGRSVPGKSSASLHPQSDHTRLTCGAPHPPPAGRRSRRAQRRESQPARSTGGPTAARESAAVRPATCGRHTEWAFGGRSVPGKFSASSGLRPWAALSACRLLLAALSARRRRHAGGTANIAGDGFATLAARGRARAHLLALLRPLRALAGPAAPGRRDRVGDLPGRALGDHRDARPGRLGWR